MDTEAFRTGLHPAPGLRTVAKEKVLSGTYFLLGMAMLFSAVIAIFMLALGAPQPAVAFTACIYLAMLFIIYKHQDSPPGILYVFSLMAFIGYTLGPLLELYWVNASALTIKGLAIMSLLFMSLSAFVTRVNNGYGFARSMVFISAIITFILYLTTVVFSLPAIQLATTCFVVLVLSAAMVLQSNRIVDKGENHDILVVGTLFASLINALANRQIPKDSVHYD